MLKMSSKVIDSNNSHESIADVSSFNVGNRVCYGGKMGTVKRVSDKAVHVKYDDGFYEKFHFNPYHHMQTPIEKLTFCC